jgi:hypothetical protein
VCLLAMALLASITDNLYSQRERQIPPSAPPDRAQYSRAFFTQLRGVFGRFRDSDLQRVFETARPIECGEFVNGDGEWRTVAFFNEKRELGDWYRSNFDEVKSDLSVFVFRGVCRSERGPVQLVTKFPVRESVDAYSHGTIPESAIEVNVNAPVSVFFDARAQTYTFDLPYLFLIAREDDANIYSLEPQRLLERQNYATDVADHWECKSVAGEAVTYHFLICRSTTLPRDLRIRNQSRPAFGASAYFILSDGREASSSVRLTFNNEDVAAPATPNVEAAQDAPPRWQLAEAEDRMADLDRDPLRIRFDADIWRGRISSAQVLSQGALYSLESSRATPGADYCVWFPGDPASVRLVLAAQPEDSLDYVVAARDQDGQSATSLTFDLKTRAGVSAGNLKCTFPRTPSVRRITVGQLIAIVGDRLVLEVKIP